MTTLSDEAEIASHTSPARDRLELLVVGTAALAVSLSQSLLIPALGILPRQIPSHPSSSTVEWLLTATLLVGAVAVPLFGRLGDMFGKRLMLMVAVVALVVGSVLCGVTSNVPLLIVGRAIQGVSMAAILARPPPYLELSCLAVWRRAILTPCDTTSSPPDML